MTSRIRILVFGLLMAFQLQAQNSDQISLYINAYKSLAIVEMQRTGVPASITLAQGIHETQAGTSDLVIASHNHFGIKCKDTWKGQVVYHDDDARGECFRSYSSADDSYRDHSDFLKSSSRYAFLFKLSPDDYEGWAWGLRKAGYATNVKYSQILIKLIREYNLQHYDLIALGKIQPDPAEGNLLAGNNKNELPGFTQNEGPKSEPPFNTYPEGTFVINGAKAIYVHSGVSLLSLSTQYDIPLARLLEFNDMNQEDVLNASQLIYLQRKRKTGNSSFHIVQPEESIYSICQAEGIRYESILEYNRLKPGEEPAPGEKLNLQTVTENKPALRNQASAKMSSPSS